MEKDLKDQSEKIKELDKLLKDAEAKEKTAMQAAQQYMSKKPVAKKADKKPQQALAQQETKTDAKKADKKGEKSSTSSDSESDSE